jgi:FkbM family methyltransferase
MTLNALVARLLKRTGLISTNTIVVGPGLGLRFDPGPSNPNYASGNNELPVQEALVDHLRAGSVFYDIGANVGFLAVLGARLVGQHGMVYAFEPVPSNAAYVRRNAQANRLAQVQVIEKAVSNVSSTGELNLAKYSGGAALALANVDAPPDADGTIQVDIVTVDDLVEHQGLKPPDVVKIDVEGAELEVLEGMEATMKRHRPVIIVEFDAAEAAPLQRKQTAGEQWLRSRGYRVQELPDSYAGSEWLVKHVVATPA